MIKLDYIIPQDRFAPAREHWKIDDDINVRIVRYDDYAVFSIQNITGDIADQIYKQATLIEYFSDLKLEVTSNYTIEVPLEKLDSFLHYVEKIDRTQLKEGKRY
jgi:hypothetical protein